jgi:hypothetical protein
MYYLITYSQQGAGGKELFANKVIDNTPTQWLLEMNKTWRDQYTRLYFAVEISKEDYEAAEGEL